MPAPAGFFKRSIWLRFQLATTIAFLIPEAVQLGADRFSGHNLTRGHAPFPGHSKLLFINGRSATNFVAFITRSNDEILAT